MALRFSALALIIMAALACASAATTPSTDASAAATPSTDASASAPAASSTPSDDIGTTDPLADDTAMSPDDDVVEGGLGAPLPAGVLPPPDMSQSTTTDAKDSATHNASSAVKLQAAAVAGFACVSLSLLL